MIRSLPPIARARRQTAFVVRRLQELNSDQRMQMH